MRDLSQLELTAILKLVAHVHPPSLRSQLAADVKRASVIDKLGDGSRLVFDIPGYERPKYTGQHPFRGIDGFPISGVVLDADGRPVEVWLYADPSERVFELELDKDSGSTILQVDWGTLVAR